METHALKVSDRRRYRVDASVASGSELISSLYLLRSQRALLVAGVFALLAVAVPICDVLTTPKVPPSTISDVHMLITTVPTNDFRSAYAGETDVFGAPHRFAAVLKQDHVNTSYFLAQLGYQQDPALLKSAMERVVRDEAFLSTRADSSRLVLLEYKAFGEVRTFRAKSHLERLSSRRETTAPVIAFFFAALILGAIGSLALGLSLRRAARAHGRVSDDSVVLEPLAERVRVKRPWINL